MVAAAWRGQTSPAVITPEGTWSGDELLARAAGAADWLDAVGVPEGTPVPALVVSSAPAFALVIGAAGSGRPLAPLGPRHTARELSAVVGPLGAEVLVTELAHVGLAAEIAERTSVRVEVIPELPASMRQLDADPAANSVAVIMHTSGTTGDPRAVPWRQDRLGLRVGLNAALTALGPGTAYATASPFHHIAGFGNHAISLAAGGALVPPPQFSVALSR